MTGTPTVEQQWKQDGRMPSGFDYMRIALAVCVLLWHSAQMAYGKDYALSLWRSPAGYLIELILPMFFALSGFLVTSSLERTDRLSDFLMLRFVRIYPALIVEVLLSAFILGPLVTSETMHHYFLSTKFASYMLNITGYIHYFLPGVFEGNPFPNVVNSSLWTVPFELECYILISVLVLIGYKKSVRTSVGFLIACTVLLAIYMTFTHQSGRPDGNIHGRVLILCFLAGSVLFRARHVTPYSGRLAVLAFLLSVFLFRVDGAIYLGPICAAYFTMWLGLQNPKRTIIVKSGDYSYGTYLYAGPIQQTAAWILGPSNTYVANVLISLPATVCFALFSWFAVEKPFIKVKRYFRKAPPQVRAEEEAGNALAASLPTG